MKKIIFSSLVAGIMAISLNGADCIMVKELDTQFKNGSTTYVERSGTKERIAEFADFMKKTDLYALIEGHTSSLAPAELNYNLANDRSVKVMQELLNLGVKKNHIKAMSFGESSPLYDNNTPEGAAKNRRIVAEVFNSVQELESYMRSQKERIKDIKLKEQ